MPCNNTVGRIAVVSNPNPNPNPDPDPDPNSNPNPNAAPNQELESLKSSLSVYLGPGLR